MLIHIGNGYLVRERDVIGFFDLDGAVTPEDTAEFLKRAEKEGRCSSAVLDLPRCFVLKSPRGNRQARGFDDQSVGRENNFSRDRRRKAKHMRTDEVILSHLSSSALAGRGNG